MHRLSVAQSLPFEIRDTYKMVQRFSTRSLFQPDTLVRCNHFRTRWIGYRVFSTFAKLLSSFQRTKLIKGMTRHNYR